VDDPRISVIIPTLNEAACLPATLHSLQQSENTQIIVVDGGSTDCTCDIAHAAGCTVLKHQRGRAVQMNAGAEASEGEILLLLHADTRLPAGFDRAIRSALSNPKVAAGAFRLRIDASGWPLRLIERGVVFRSRLFQMPYGDQGIFLRAGLFRELGKMPRLPIMEDFELVRKLRKRGKIEILPCDAVTSARRWKTVGPWKTTFINLCVILGYYLGIAPERLAQWYQSFARDRTAVTRA
jgi:rSAM/selenodomain-associated transferase 2